MELDPRAADRDSPVELDPRAADRDSPVELEPRAAGSDSAYGLCGLKATLKKKRDSLVEGSSGVSAVPEGGVTAPAWRYILHFAVPPEHVPQTDHEPRHGDRGEQHKLDDVLKPNIQQYWLWCPETHHPAITYC